MTGLLRGLCSLLLLFCLASWTPQIETAELTLGDLAKEECESLKKETEDAILRSSVYNKDTGKCYVWLYFNGKWDDARDQCQFDIPAMSYFGNTVLAKLDTKSETEYFIKQLPFVLECTEDNHEINLFWVGGTNLNCQGQEKEEFVWVSDLSNMTQSPWNPEEPSAQCCVAVDCERSELYAEDCNKELTGVICALQANHINEFPVQNGRQQPKWSPIPTEKKSLIPTVGFPHGPMSVWGGEIAPKNSWPWVVEIVAFYAKKWSQQCGGSILDEYHVLTAAHCVVDETTVKLPNGTEVTDFEKLSNSKVRIYLGVHDTSLRQQHEYRDVADIAVLKDFVKNGLGPDDLAERRGPENQRKLTQMEARVLPPEMCWDNVAPHVICARGTHKKDNLCPGDSGSGLMCKENNVWVVHGTLSSGYGSTCYRHSDRTTNWGNVYYHLKWIKHTLKNVYA